MNIYYEFESDVPREQLQPLLGWVMNHVTNDGDTSSWHLAKHSRPRKNKCAPVWLLSIEVWDTDNFSEEVYIDREDFDAALASHWLVLLLDEKLGGRRFSTFECDTDGEDAMELAEVIGHIMAHGTMGYSWGDGPSAFMFDKKDGYHVPMGTVLDNYDPIPDEVEKIAHRKQITMFDLFKG